MIRGGILATDSQSLLDTLLNNLPKCSGPAADFSVPQKGKQVEALSADSPEWDIVSNILTHLASQPSLTLQYVRGHQDRHTAYENLYLLAQLNVEADAMATAFQVNHGRQRPNVLLTDTAYVHLVTPRGSVTSK
jgi:hypothetical protein